MGAVDGTADLAEELDPLADRQLLVLAVAVDRLAVDQLHDQVRQAVCGGAAVEDLGDPGMIQCGEDLPLDAQPPPSLVVQGAGDDELDGDLAVEGLVVAHRSVDGTHPTFADLLA